MPSKIPCGGGLRLTPRMSRHFRQVFVSISYTDTATGEFIVDLKSTGIWDDSIIVVMATTRRCWTTGPNPTTPA
jgi:hypothetical protein